MRVRIEIVVFAIALVAVVVYKAVRWDDVAWIAPEADPARGGVGKARAGIGAEATGAGLGNEGDGPKTEEYPPGKKAPRFALPTEKGTLVTLESLRGRVVMYNVFATWCEPCMEELPFVEELQRRLGPKGFTAVLASWNKNAAELREKWKPDATPVTLVFDSDKSVGARFGTSKVPEAYLIDKEGNVRWKFTHARRWTDDKYVAIVEKLLLEGKAAPAPAPPTATAPAPATAPARYRGSLP
ncbi:MAG: TlpA family protein disulfide reductase [Deltaproteobacteria bacterium]|nr:TlpA family protein disulfide reductase [Deltaproteobacteria bacterium]